MSAQKLRGVFEWFDPEDPAYDPIAVVRPEELPTRVDVDASYVSIDGHTRAFAAALCGAETLRIRVETGVDAPEVYARCLEWCAEANVRTPADFAGRVVSHETYLEEWVDRCRAIE